jgi:hypothetical protein
MAALKPGFKYIEILYEKESSIKKGSFKKPSA